MEEMGEGGIGMVERLGAMPAVEEENEEVGGKEPKRGPTTIQPAKPQRYGEVLRVVKWD